MTATKTFLVARVDVGRVPDADSVRVLELDRGVCKAVSLLDAGGFTRPLELVTQLRALAAFLSG